MEKQNSNQSFIESENTGVENTGIIDRLKSTLGDFFSDDAENAEPEQPKTIEGLKTMFKACGQENVDNNKTEASVNAPNATSRDITISFNINGSDSVSIKSIEQCDKTIIVKLQI